MEKEVLCEVQFPIYCSETLDEDMERIILNSNTPLTQSQLKHILKTEKRKAATRMEKQAKIRKKEQTDRENTVKEREEHHHGLREREIVRDYHKSHHENNLWEGMKDNTKQHGRVATKDNTPKEVAHPVREIRERRELRLTFQSPQLRRRFEEVARSVPGRREQAYRIFDYISMAENGATSPICLHGNTGCGKTSLITKVLDFFAANSKTVQVAYLNCMNMWSTHHVCTGILSKIFETKEKRNANALLRERFEQCGRRAAQKTKIIVLDEIDQFINDEQFLYNMLDWLDIRDAKIILVLISNVIDLTLRLNGKLQSRLKFQAVIFKPYSYQQVEEIIYYKYPDILSLLHRDAVTFVSKKIANINSDIRLLERIYQRLVNQFLSGGKQLLTVQDVSSLILEENGNPRMLPVYAILTRILHRAAKKEEVSHEIFHRLFLQGSRNPRSDEIVLMLCDLKDSGLISLSTTNRKNSDFTFHDLGIKLREDLHDFIGEEQRK